MKLLEFIFRDFLHWLGFMTILYVTVYFITNLLNNFMRYRVLMKHGYSLCNGENSPIKKEEEVEKVNE
jgi:hypothetical protein